MNLTASPELRPASRLTGLALAIGVHVILVVGFAGAFIIKTPVKPLETKVDVVKQEPKPPEPIVRHVVNQSEVRPTDPLVPPVLPPVWEPARDTPTMPLIDEGIRNDVGPVGIQHADPAVRTEPKGPLKAGDVCTRMTAPEMPPVNFAGDATFRVVASTQAGHVTSVQIQALSSGIDSRSLRAFKGAIERALSAYECPGNVSFTQEFNFRLE